MIGLRLLERLAPEAAPAVDASLCLSRVTNVACDRCAQICPRHAISTGPYIAPAACDRCWLCAAACPALAIRPPEPPAAHFQVHVVQRGVVALSCNAGATGGAGTACLASLGEAAIMRVFGDGAASVILETDQCAACPRRQGAAALNKLAQRVEALLEAFGPGREIRLASAPKAGSAARNGDLSRREALVRVRNGMAGHAKALACDLLIGVLGEPRQIEAGRAENRSRQLILQLRRLGAPVQPLGAAEMPWLALEADGSCSVCGLCTAACPTRALAIHPSVDALALELNVAACVGCGRCLEACPAQALRRAENVLLEPIIAGQALIVAQQRQARCPRCGTRYAANGCEEVCPSCKASASLAAWLKARLECEELPVTIAGNWKGRCV